MQRNKIYLIINKNNVGISKGSNQAIDFITNTLKPEIIAKVDPDAIFQSTDWLSTILKLYKSNHQLILSLYPEGLIHTPGGAPRYHRGLIAGELLGMTNHLGGVCVFASAKAYDNFRWDENDYLHAAQDLAFSQYVTTHGYAMAYLENYSLRHATAEMEAQYPEYYERRKLEKRTKYESNR